MADSVLRPIVRQWQPRTLARGGLGLHGRRSMLVTQQRSDRFAATVARRGEFGVRLGQAGAGFAERIAGTTQRTSQVSALDLTLSRRIPLIHAPPRRRAAAVRPSHPITPAPIFRVTDAVPVVPPDLASFAEAVVPEPPPPVPVIVEAPRAAPPPDAPDQPIVLARWIDAEIALEAPLPLPADAPEPATDLPSPAIPWVATAAPVPIGAPRSGVVARATPAARPFRSQPASAVFSERIVTSIAAPPLDRFPLATRVAARTDQVTAILTAPPPTLLLAPRLRGRPDRVERAGVLPGSGDAPPAPAATLRITSDAVGRAPDARSDVPRSVESIAGAPPTVRLRPLTRSAALALTLHARAAAPGVQPARTIGRSVVGAFSVATADVPGPRLVPAPPAVPDAIAVERQESERFAPTDLPAGVPAGVAQPELTIPVEPWTPRLTTTLERALATSAGAPSITAVRPRAAAAPLLALAMTHAFWPGSQTPWGAEGGAAPAWAALSQTPADRPIPPTAFAPTQRSLPTLGLRPTSRPRAAGGASVFDRSLAGSTGMPWMGAFHPSVIPPVIPSDASIILSSTPVIRSDIEESRRRAPTWQQTDDVAATTVAARSYAPWTPLSQPILAWRAAIRPPVTTETTPFLPPAAAIASWVERSSVGAEWVPGAEGPGSTDEAPPGLRMRPVSQPRRGFVDSARAFSPGPAPGYEPSAAAPLPTILAGVPTGLARTLAAAATAIARHTPPLPSWITPSAASLDLTLGRRHIARREPVPATAPQIGRSSAPTNWFAPTQTADPWQRFVGGIDLGTQPVDFAPTDALDLLLSTPASPGSPAAAVDIDRPATEPMLSGGLARRVAERRLPTFSTLAFPTVNRWLDRPRLRREEVTRTGQAAAGAPVPPGIPWSPTRTASWLPETILVDPWARMLGGQGTSPGWSPPPPSVPTLRRRAPTAGPSADAPIARQATTPWFGVAETLFAQPSPASAYRTPATVRPFVPAPASFGMPRMLFRSAVGDDEPGAEQQEQAAQVIARSVGQPLPVAVRRPMERLLGADLTTVRVHAGPTIARAASLVSARAMATGSDVFLPTALSESPAPDELPLLAHELTHVVRHSGQSLGSPAAAPPLTLARRASSEEREADEVERMVTTAIQRQAPSPAQALTLARAPSPTTIYQVEPAIQRQDETTEVAEPAVGTIAPAPEGAEGGAAAGAGAPAANPNEIAEKVFELLQDRLIKQRERGGYVR